MSKLTGCEYENCGHSGANVWTWQTLERGLPKAKTVGRPQAYIIGLGLNDISNSDRAIPLGTIDDIGTENRTYYAGLSKIVRELNAINPEAFIFIQTMATTGTNYNVAIRDVVSTYQSTYKAHLLDLEKYASLYQKTSISSDAIGGHYTAIGYQQFAKILGHVWSEYIVNNISTFQNVHLIPYE